MAGATGSGLFLNGQEVDPKTLSPNSLVYNGGLLATPEQWAAAAAATGVTTPVGGSSSSSNNIGSSSSSNNGGGIDVSAVPTMAEIQAGWGKNSSQLPSASSAESYINDWQNSATAAAQQALKAAYDSNMLTLNAAGEKIPAQYQAARNQTAAQSELQRGNFNEFAAASGLNSGAGGQAQLAMSNQLQGDLSGITQAEATAKADLELQRTQLATQYQNDIAKSLAEGNLAEAQAKYDAYLKKQDYLINQNRYDDQTGYDRTYAAAVTSGIFDSMAAFGWSPAQIASAHDDWLKSRAQ